MKAEYVHNTNNDLMIANTARVSFNNWNSELDFSPNSKGIPKDVSLINYLAKELHISPFFHVRLTLELPAEAINLYAIEDPTYIFRAVWAPAPTKHHQKMMYFRHSYYGWVRLLKEGVIAEPYRAGVYAALDKEAFRLSNEAYNLKSVWLPSFDPACNYSTDVVPNANFVDYSMRITSPISILRQLFTHRQFDSNELSRRYVSSEPEIYSPPEWREKPIGSIKQGSAGVHHLTEGLSMMYDRAVRNAALDYSEMIHLKVAPEMARFILPQGMESTMIFTGSAVAWKRMITARTDSHAQAEIQALAQECLEQLTTSTDYAAIV